MEHIDISTWDESKIRIIRAALKVVNDNTISGTRMTLIAKEAGMSTTNLHYHFNTKEELMFSLLCYIQEEFHNLRREDLIHRENTLDAQLSGFFEQKKYFLMNEYELDTVQFDFWASSRVNPEISPVFEDAFQKWRQDIINVVLLYDKNQDPEKLKLVSEIMVSMMMGTIIQNFRDKSEKHLDDYFDCCFKMIKHMLDED